MDSVKNRFLSGIAWTFVQNVAVKGFGLVFMILLMRLLNPSDYGLIGMLSIFIVISEVFILCGFGEALVQKNNCTDEDFTTAFYFNVGVALLIYCILFAFAPLIASFYKEPQLNILTKVLSLNFVFGSLNIVQQAKLTKAMKFKSLAIISLICVIVSGFVGVIMAYCGLGVWALVGQTMSATALRVIIFPLFTHWHPNRSYCYESLKHLWNYGSKLLFTGVSGVIIINISNILIGRFYDKNQVGYFSRSQSLAAVPSETLFYMLNSVSFPTLCEVQDDQMRRLGIYKKMLFNTVLFVCPIIIILALLAKPLVVILFTERWSACIPLFQALLLARLFMPIGATHTALLRSVGNTTLYMKLYFITGPLSLIAVIVSIPFGVVAMAWATFVGALLSYLVLAYVIGKKFCYNIFEQFWDWRYIFYSLVLMIVSVYLCVHWITGMWAQLIVGIVAGGGVYLICCKVFNLIDDELVRLIKSKIISK